MGSSRSITQSQGHEGRCEVLGCRPTPPLTAALEEAHRLAVATGSPLPNAVLIRGVVAWTQLFGAISREVFGHLRGAFANNRPIFTETIGQMAHLVGLRSTAPSG